MRKRLQKRAAQKPSAAILLVAVAALVAGCSSKNPDAITAMNLDENQALDAMNAIASAPANSSGIASQPAQSAQRDSASQPQDSTEYPGLAANHARTLRVAVDPEGSNDADAEAPAIGDEDAREPLDSQLNTEQTANQM